MVYSAAIASASVKQVVCVAGIPKLSSPHSLFIVGAAAGPRGTHK